MRRSIPILVVAIVLALLGGVSLSAGLFERRMAIAQEDMAVLREARGGDRGRAPGL
jgi:hypothetical protein